MRDPGAPLDLYRLLEPAGEPELIHAEVRDGATILDLGCGTGRITHSLLRLGYDVTAVDFDERMLREIKDAETVLSRIEDLELGRASTTGSTKGVAGSPRSRSDRARRRIHWPGNRATTPEDSLSTVDIRQG